MELVRNTYGLGTHWESEKEPSPTLKELWEKVAIFDKAFLRLRRELMQEQVKSISRMIEQEKIAIGRQVSIVSDDDVEFIVALHRLSYYTRKRSRLENAIMLLDL